MGKMFVFMGLGVQKKFARLVNDLQNSVETVLTLDLSSEKQRFYWRFCDLSIRARAIFRALPQVTLFRNRATV